MKASLEFMKIGLLAMGGTAILGSMQRSAELDRRVYSLMGLVPDSDEETIREVIENIGYEIAYPYACMFGSLPPNYQFAVLALTTLPEKRIIMLISVSP